MNAPSHQVTFFVVPHCPLCTEVRTWLDRHRIEYDEQNVAGDWGALRIMYEGTRQRLVPVLKVDDQFLVRPSAEELSRLLS